MTFEKFLRKLRSSKEKQSSEGGTTSKIKSSENFLAQRNSHLKSSVEINRALAEVNKAIQKEGSNNQLLLQKADILLKKGKINQARQILNNLANKKNDKLVSSSAKNLLAISRQSQENKTANLSTELEKIALRYKFHLGHFPLRNSTTESNLIQFIREEAHRAIESELPVLSYELVNKATSAGLKSPWLLLSKSISLGMIGHRENALDLLEKLKSASNGDKITNAIDKAIKDIKRKNKIQQQLKFNVYLAKHLKAINNDAELCIEFLPSPKTINDKTNIKSLIFAEALKLLESNPRQTLQLVDSILDFAPNDGASLQLKGEAFAALKEGDRAIQTWIPLARCQNEKVSQKAYTSISKNLSQRAKRMSSNMSSEVALEFYINQFLKNNLVPVMTPIIGKIINQVQPLDSSFTDPELRQHKLQLQFNTIVIDCLETHLIEKGRLSPTVKVQAPSGIRKTAPKEG